MRLLFAAASLALCTGVLCVACSGPPQVDASASDPAPRALAFRGYLQGYPSPEHEGYWDREGWMELCQRLAREGFNAIVWYGPNEFSNGSHALVRHREFPEARELRLDENERIIAHWQWVFDCAHQHGLQNYLLTQHIFVTKAFATAHGLLDPRPASATVSHWQTQGYPNFWPGDPAPIHHCGVRNELTRSYTEAVYVELIETYPSLDGFWGYAGEPLPGNRSTFFGEAVLPALQRASRRPRYVANQWQIPLPDFMADIRAGASTDDLWLGFHGYNSEQITDARPYPGVVRWAETTGLPTVPDIYPANQLYFPFNSPRFAHEIVRETRRVEGLAGYLYYERHISGSLLGPLFRQALARYGKRFEPYDDDPWLAILVKQVGNEAAARHLLAAYDACARVIPETCALVYCGGDVMRRELRLPYEFFAQPFPWSHVTSPARGGTLVPVRHYARMLVRDRDRYTGDGSDGVGPPFYQHPLWGSQGGSVYDVTPTAHMRSVRALGARARAEAEAAFEKASAGVAALAVTRDIMTGVDLLAAYYELKIAATVAALVAAETGDGGDKQRALEAADRALESYLGAAEFMAERLDPYYLEISGAPMTEAGVGFAELIAAERRDRARIAEIFGWP